jgi:hypothetical protein
MMPVSATFLAYSGNGHVKEEVVYANYGMREDFLFLQSINVSVAGKIVLVRYEQIFRGNKVSNAQEVGALTRSADRRMQRWSLHATDVHALCLYVCDSLVPLEC